MTTVLGGLGQETLLVFVTRIPRNGTLDGLFTYSRLGLWGWGAALGEREEASWRR